MSWSAYLQSYLLVLFGEALLFPAVYCRASAPPILSVHVINELWGVLRMLPALETSDRLQPILLLIFVFYETACTLALTTAQFNTVFGFCALLTDSFSLMYGLYLYLYPRISKSNLTTNNMSELIPIKRTRLLGLGFALHGLVAVLFGPLSRLTFLSTSSNASVYSFAAIFLSVSAQLYLLKDWLRGDEADESESSMAFNLYQTSTCTIVILSTLAVAYTATVATLLTVLVDRSVDECQPSWITTILVQALQPMYGLAGLVVTFLLPRTNNNRKAAAGKSQSQRLKRNRKTSAVTVAVVRQ